MSVLNIYHINTPEGREIYNGYYNKSGQYHFSPLCDYANSRKLGKYLEDESSYKIKFEYYPINDGFDAFHQLLESECKEQGVCITNIYPESYAIVYCLKTEFSHSYIKISYNGRKIITTVSPFSTAGTNDHQLNAIIDSLKHLWQR